MTYLDYINAFWKKHELEPFMASEAMIYFYLLDKFNKGGWPSELKLSNKVASVNVGISENTFKKGRYVLKNRELIDYEAESKKGAPTLYWLNDFKKVKKVSIDITKKVSKNDSEADTKRGEKQEKVSEKVSALVSESASKIDTINKTKNKTKNLKACVGERTHTHEEVFLEKFTEMARKYAPWCYENLRMPSEEECKELLGKWKEEDIIKRLKNQENSKGARENATVLLTNIEKWLEEDEEKGKIRRKSEGQRTTDNGQRREDGASARNDKQPMTERTEEDAREGYINMLKAEMKKGGEKAEEARKELRKMGVEV